MNMPENYFTVQVECDEWFKKNILCNTGFVCAYQTKLKS